jgi:beta-barrel assembly-enhancing protease
VGSNPTLSAISHQELSSPLAARVTVIEPMTTVRVERVYPPPLPVPIARTTLALVKIPATLFLSAALAFGAASRSVAGPEDLPDIGSPAQAMLSLEDEYQIGRMIVRGLRDQDQILEDPEVAEYIRSVGSRLSSQANEGSRRFNFFVVKENTINAFALPGGFIGVNSGLLLQTKNESELAGVIAHEVAHVTQRHIARSLAAQSRTSLVSTAAMLAAILVGAAAGGGGDAAMAGVAAAQSLAIQQQISFTRDNETEADRVGLGILARSGFDPRGMPAFFDTMSRFTGGSETNIPEMLRTHPVTSTRIAETKERAAQLEVAASPESISYALTRERLRVLSTPAGENPREYYAAIIDNEPDATSAQVYGKALALMLSGQPAKAVPIFERLRNGDPTVVQYHTALGQAQLLAGKGENSLTTLQRARDLFPRNIAVTVRYAEALMQLGEPKRAHEILLDLFNVVPPTPEQAKLTAMAANAAGDVADSYYYMSEYHLMSGDLPLAINQLQLALSVPKISDVQRARFEARLEEVQQALPKRSVRRPAQQEGGNRRRAS